MNTFIDTNTVGIVKLSNGIRVANFSSPHDFTFEDGTVLAARDPEVSVALQVEIQEVMVSENTIQIIPYITDTIAIEMKRWEKTFKLHKKLIVICPRLMLDALYQQGAMPDDILATPFRTIRLADRITKTVCIDRFCI